MEQSHTFHLQSGPDSAKFSKGKGTGAKRQRFFGHGEAAARGGGVWSGRAGPGRGVGGGEPGWGRPRVRAAVAAILLAGRTSQVWRAGRRGARPRDPAPPGSLGSAGRERSDGRAGSRERNGPLRRAGEPDSRPGSAGGGGLLGPWLRAALSAEAAVTGTGRQVWRRRPSRGAVHTPAPGRWSPKGSGPAPPPAGPGPGVSAHASRVLSKYTAGEAEPAGAGAPAAARPSPGVPLPQCPRPPGCVGAPPARAPPASRGPAALGPSRAGAVFKVFLKGLTVAVSALRQTVASQSETRCLLGCRLASWEPRELPRWGPASAPSQPGLPPGPFPPSRARARLRAPGLQPQSPPRRPPDPRRPPRPSPRGPPGPR